MPILSTIRNKTGLLIAVVAGGVVLFLVQDALNSNFGIFNRTPQEVGEISNEDIKLKDFDAELKKQEASYQLNSGQTPGEAESQRIRDEVWRSFLVKIAFQKEYDELGIQVTKGEEGEQVDMVQGKCIHPAIANQFKNQQTGQFDVSQVQQFLSQIKDPQTNEAQMTRTRWQLFQEYLLTDRVRSKYEDLLRQTNYVTKAEAQRSLWASQSKVSFDYVYLPFYAIVDSTIKPSDADLKAYLDKNKAQFRVDEGRTIEYVSFSLAPSAADSAAMLSQVQEIKAEFQTRNDDTSFVMVRSENATPPTYFKKSEIPYSLQRDSIALNAGQVYGPYLEANAYKLYKVISAKRDTVNKATASHILVKVEQNATEEQKKAAKAKAESILASAISGADFGALVLQHSDDPGSKAKNGDLGEFQTGAMVKPFETAVFKAKKVGVIPYVVESQFGYHIINVTVPRALVSMDLKYLIATIEKSLYAGNETSNEILRKASIFQKSVTSLESLREMAKKDGKLTVQVATNVASSASAINSISDARSIVRWAYLDAEVGEVSAELYRLKNEYVIAALASVKEKDDYTVENLKDELTYRVRNEMKAKQLTELLQSTKGTPQERFNAIVAKKGPTYAVYNTAVDVNLANPSIPGVGNEPAMAGTAFGIKQGATSKVLTGENGVYLITVTNKVEATDLAEYKNEKLMLESRYKGSENYSIEEAIRENANVKDLRYRFY